MQRGQHQVAGVFFSGLDRPVEPISFGLGQDRCQAHIGGARSRRMAERIARTIGPVTATSASWKVMARAWRTTLARIFISRACWLVSDQLAIYSGTCIHQGQTST
jgi:hypothetical protein